jgi:Bacterial PH domain
MSVQRTYRSKVDGKIAGVTVLTIAVLIVAGATMPDRNHDTAIVLHAVSLFCLALCVWTLLGTYYVIDATSLVVRSGPFHWTVALRDIRSVQATRDIRSGPALSFDRLRIEYGAGRVLLISPREKDAFLADLARRGVHGVIRSLPE